MPEPTLTRILLVDDHPVVRRSLADLLTEEGFDICGEAGSVAEALEAIDGAGCDLAIVDISLGGASGLDLVKRLAARSDRPRVLVLSMHDESLFAERVLRAGADGYVGKREAVDRVVEAVRTVLDGRTYLSPEMTERILRIAKGRATETGTLTSLSDRELEIFDLLGRGVSTRDIARRLGLSVKTVETHRENVKAKLGLRNSTELLRHAVRWVLERG